MLCGGRLFVGLLASVFLGTVVTKDPQPKRDDTQELQPEGSNREGKLWFKFPIVKIVTFENTQCTTTSGSVGTCYTKAECFFNLGQADGECAEGNGVCCNMNIGGNTTIWKNGQEFLSEGYPFGSTTSNKDESTVTVAEINPPLGTVQIKLTFTEFELSPPIDGDCTNDTFVFEGANPGVEIPVLCGYNTGQHLFIDVDNSEGPFKLIKTIGAGSDFERKMKVAVDFYSALSPVGFGRAPFRCQQYCCATEGNITSFNYAEDSPMMLNNQNYNICFGYVTGYCDIGFNFDRLDLGNINGNCEDDWVSVGLEKQCGDVADFSIQANATGTISMVVNSDDENSDQHEGFSTTYMMMEC